MPQPEKRGRGRPKVPLILPSKDLLVYHLNQMPKSRLQHHFNISYLTLQKWIKNLGIVKNEQGVYV